MERNSPTVILFFKPYSTLSQFSEGIHPGRHTTITSFGPFPRDVYPAGRLDADSEGLILLTNDPLLRHRLLDPRFHHPRTYLVQVERIPDGSALRRLANGSLVLDGRKVRPAEARLLEEEPQLPPRSTPIRFRKNVPTAWLELRLFEGRNRQVRRMTAAVGHPALRLIRTQIASLTLAGLAPGKWRALSRRESARFADEIHTTHFRSFLGDGTPG
jgi:23S rRNA pseudouridine2457 synthase